jgi:hypothetical protein
MSDIPFAILIVLVIIVLGSLCYTGLICMTRPSEKTCNKFVPNSIELVIDIPDDLSKIRVMSNDLLVTPLLIKNANGDTQQELGHLATWQPTNVFKLTMTIDNLDGRFTNRIVKLVSDVTIHMRVPNKEKITWDLVILMCAPLR